MGLELNCRYEKHVLYYVIYYYAIVICESLSLIEYNNFVDNLFGLNSMYYDSVSIPESGTNMVILQYSSIVI